MQAIKSLGSQAFETIGDQVPFSKPREIKYKHGGLACAFILLSLIVPLYLICEAAVNKSYAEDLETESYFTVSPPEGAGTLIRDLDAIIDNTSSTFYDLDSLVIKESDSIVLVPTRLVDTIQVQEVCGPSALNPPVTCSSDDDCITYYGSAENTSCDSGLCNYSPFLQWCNRNVTDVTFNEVQQSQLLLHVNARISCEDNYVFSNHDPSIGAVGINNYTVTLESVLQDLAQDGDVSDNFDQYLLTGLDVRFEYQWDCNLDKLSQSDRYDCPIVASTHRLSQGSNTTNSRVIWIQFVDGVLTRRYQTMYGLRLRFVSSGGCKKTTSDSLLKFLAGGFTLDVVNVYGMAFLAFIFHTVMKVPKPVDEISMSGKGWGVKDTMAALKGGLKSAMSDALSEAGGDAFSAGSDGLRGSADGLLGDKFGDLKDKASEVQDKANDAKQKFDDAKEKVDNAKGQVDELKGKAEDAKDKKKAEVKQKVDATKEAAVKRGEETATELGVVVIPKYE